MQKFKILWADDEIDLLKPHIMLLETRGYEVTSVISAMDALEKLDENFFDVVFLDENMPGMGGLEALARIKQLQPNMPVVMITKNEEETIMEEAIGAKIADYLIKPLNPNQILLSVKKLLENKRILTERINAAYQQEFVSLSQEISDADTHQTWAAVYKKLVYWAMQIQTTDAQGMNEILQTQLKDANHRFASFIQEHYESWLQSDSQDRPILSHQLLRKEIFPLIGDQPVILLVIDNLRYDQWEILEPAIADFFDIEKKDHYYAILPTATAYARNALFAGMMPLDIQKRFPELWSGEDDDAPKNAFEKELLEANLRTAGIKEKITYHKIIHAADGKFISENINQLIQHKFSALVYNFVDMLSHSRTDMQMIKELAPDEAAYRALTRTWFNHSSLFETLKKLASKKVKVIITTDHGTIRVKHAERIVGDRTVNTNLRYKQGKNLAFDERKIFFTRKPENFRLPRYHVSTAYAFADEDLFFIYPNNFNHFASHFHDTFQHGGISLEEMIVPYVILSAK